MKKQINPARLAQGTTAIVFGLAFLWLAVTNSYQYYVTPHTLPYLYFAAVMFLWTGGYYLSKLHELSHVRHYARLVVLLIPLALLAVSIHAQGL